MFIREQEQERRHPVPQLPVTQHVSIENNRIYRVGAQRIAQRILPFTPDNQCCLCFEVIQPEQVENEIQNDFNVLQQSNCLHFFCKNCFILFLEAWDQDNSLRCPMCRAIFFHAIRNRNEA